jgi:hypothetical protein
MKLSVLLQQAGLLGTCLLFFGCGGEPYNYEPPNEVTPGPGLFSGEDGEFTIIGEPKENKGTSQEKEQAEAE